MRELIVVKKNEGSDGESPERAHYLVIGSTAMGMSGGRSSHHQSGRGQRGGRLLSTLRSAGDARRDSAIAALPVRVDDYVSLPPALFAEAVRLIRDLVGAELTGAAVARILSESRLGAKILYFDEVETEIRTFMTRAVAEFFTGEDWPARQSTPDYAAYQMRLRATARARGYLLQA